MEQETVRQENSEAVEPTPYTRRETIFTMVGVLCVVFLSMLDQTIPLMAVLFFLLCN